MLTLLGTCDPALFTYSLHLLRSVSRSRFGGFAHWPFAPNLFIICCLLLFWTYASPESHFLLRLVSSAASAECSGGIKEIEHHLPTVTKTWRGLHCSINRLNLGSILSPAGPPRRLHTAGIPDSSCLRLPPTEPAVTHLRVVKAGRGARRSVMQQGSSVTQATCNGHVYVFVWKTPNWFYFGGIFQAEIAPLWEGKDVKRIHRAWIPGMD